MSHPGGPSLLLAEEYFGSEDARFVEALREVFAPRQLAGFVDRWKRDPRPWARQQIFAYLAKPLDSPGHNVVVKRLFKQAEENRDDELMAAFLVVLDQMVRRVRKIRRRYDWAAREVTEEEYLASPHDVLPVHADKLPAATLAWYRKGSGKLFSHVTRHYLRRRAWRYFRRMGFQRPEQYASAIARALIAYPDEAFAQGENLLDTWGLVHACFRASDVLEFGRTHIRVREGRSLAELRPAPRFLPLWRQPEASAVLLDMVAKAKSRLVRTWAMRLLKQEHPGLAEQLSLEQLFQLLEQPDEEVQSFAAELLQRSPLLATLPLDGWFRLLGTTSLAALDLICQAMRSHVAAERLSLAECVRLACGETAVGARLGLDFLKSRRIESAEDRLQIASVAGTRCFAMSGELAAWALDILGKPEVYDRDLIVRFFDSLHQPARQAAWQWLNRADSPGHGDSGLWARLMETPYDDVRQSLVEALQRRSRLPGVGPEDLAPLWCSVLLGVHRGGRQKLKATRQMAQALVAAPAQASQLLPVLAVAVRSVRGPEARAGLAAVVGALEARPELADMVRQHLPELRWEAAEVSP